MKTFLLFESEKLPIVELTGCFYFFIAFLKMIFTWQNKDLVVLFRPYIFPLEIQLDHDISTAGNHCPREHDVDCLYLSFLT